MKILLLEDDLDLCDLIQKELSKSGHTVDRSDTERIVQKRAYRRLL